MIEATVKMYENYARGRRRRGGDHRVLIVIKSKRICRSNVRVFNNNIIKIIFNNIVLSIRLRYGNVVAMQQHTTDLHAHV